MSSTGAIPKGARSKIKKLEQDNFKTNQNAPPTNENLALSEPLEKREIDASLDGIQIKQPALHSFWVESRSYIPFSMPPQPKDDGDFVSGAVEAWIEQAEFLIEDLTWVLSLPYHRFWSQMTYDASFHECLESYLSGRSRWYEEDIPDERFSSCLDSIHRLVFLIYVRMATFKESKDDHITPSIFGHLIYQHFLFDICKMTDLSALYARSNGPLLKKMFDNIFAHQPKYHNDLVEFISSLKKVFDNLENSLGLSKLSMRLNSHFEKLSLEDLTAGIDYLVDIFFSLDAFLDIVPSTAESFRLESFDVRLAAFYEKIVPYTMKSLMELGDLPQNELWVGKLIERLTLVRLSSLSVFRKIVENSCCCCLLPQDASQDNVPSLMESYIEKFVHTFTTCVEEKTFISDYASTFRIEDDIRLFNDFGADMTTLNFVQEAVSSTVAEVKMAMDVQADANTPSTLREETSNQQPPSKSKSEDSSGMNGYYSGETSGMTQVELAMLISSINDLLPDLGSGFIKDCLVFYNYSTEEVLNAILEGNLPPSLDSIPRDKKLLENQLETTKPPQTSASDKEPDPPQFDSVYDDEEPEIFKRTASVNHHESRKGVPKESGGRNEVLSRSNVYNDDEFDVFSQTASLNLNQIHKGKKNVKYEKDSAFISKVKEIGQQYDSNLGYSIYEEETKYLPIQVLDYEDEYDDTYDDNEAGNLDDFAFDKKKPSIPTLRGAGALNVPGLDFTSSPADGSEDEDGEGNVQEGADHKPPQASLKDSKEIQDISGNFRRQHKLYQGKPDRKKQSNALVFENSKFRKGGNPPSRQNGIPPGPHASARGPPKEEAETEVKPSFDAFCENPEVLRRRAEDRRISKMERKRNWRSGAPLPPPQESGDAELNHTSAPSRGGGKSQRGGGRNRHPPGGEETDSAKQPHRGKHKEEGQGSSQESYRYKTAHKNQDRRKAAQAKYRGGF